MAGLFISCVSNEFANYRDAIRRDFSRPNLDTKIQEDFIAYGGATLEKLDDYIQLCEAVIHICGDMTGSMANEISIQYINNKYKDFGSRFPALQPVLNGTARLSYTQWEVWLGVYHGKRLFVVAPTATALRDIRYVNDPEQIAHQQEHLNRLRELGYYDEIHFNNEDDLVKNLYRSKLGDILNKIPKAKPANLPYQTIGTAFKGRVDDLKELFDIFSNTTNRVAGIALNGLGGMGKTRLAIEYALMHENDYTALLFVHAGSPELLKTNIANLSDPLIMNLPEHTAQDEEIKYAAVINRLNEYPDWLLILDNADTAAAAEKVEEVFAALQQGHVLITTRIDNWSPQIKKKRLGVLNRKDAIAFLLETTYNDREKRDDDNEVAGTIADDLGDLALALEQARAYIVTKELSLAGYRKKWEANRADVLSWFDKQQMQYPASVAITWQTSFSQLSGAAITLLNRLAWMAPDPLPKTLLEVEVPGAEPIDAAGAWEELKQYSLTASSADKKTFSIHRLVQDVTRNRLDKTLAQQTLNEGLSWIDTAFTGSPTNINDWPVLEPLIPHILSLLEYTKTHETGNGFTRLMNDAALLFFTKAQYATAEQLMRRALEIDEHSFGSNHPNVAIRLNNLAQLLQTTNGLEEAEPLMRRALEIDEQSFGSNHPRVATDLNNLAQLLKATNRIGEAEPLMRKVLEIDEQSFGSNHPRVAIGLNNLAQLLKDTNRLGEAEPLMRRALEIDERAFGSNHPNVAIDLNNLAQLLHATNRIGEAEPLMRRALEIDEHSFGSNHPNVAIRLNNLAQLLQDTNRLGEAEPLMRRALEIDEQSFDSNHPRVAIDLNNLAQLLKATNRLGEAEPLMRRALEIDKQSFGSNHPRVAIRLNNLATLLQATNRLVEAEPLMKRSFIIFLKSFGIKHPNTEKVGKNYMILLKEMGKSKEEINAILKNLL
jgi:Tetratricopeptide repeat